MIGGIRKSMDYTVPSSELTASGSKGIISANWHPSVRAKV